MLSVDAGQGHVKENVGWCISEETELLQVKGSTRSTQKFTVEGAGENQGGPALRRGVRLLCGKGTDGDQVHQSIDIGEAER